MDNNINYWNLLTSSFSLFFKNLVLLVPILIAFAFMIGWSIVIGIEVLIFFVINGTALFDFNTLLIGFNVLLILFFVVIDVVLIVWISAFTRSMVIGMLKDVAIKGKATVRGMFGYGKRYVKVYFRYLWIQMVLLLVPLIVFGLIVFALFGVPILNIVMAVLLSLIFIAYAIFIGIGLFFMDPMIASKDGRAWEIVKGSFSYLKKAPGHVLATWGIILLVTIVLALIRFPFSIGTSVLSIASPFAGTVLNIFISIIFVVINIIVSIWMQIFLFRSWFAKN